MIFKALVFMAMNFSGAADVNLAETILVKEYPKEPLLNEVVAFEPIAGHQFNLVAKNQCGNGRLLDTSESRIECQMYAPGSGKVELYVCDKKKTFCRREELMLKTQQPKGFKAWVQYYKDSISTPNSWATPYRTGVSTMSAARGFTIPADLDKALFKVKNDKKLILVYFTQASCEPCRMLKELSINSDEFQATVADMHKFQIDIDVENSPETLKPLKIRGTPTMIVFNKSFQEIDRRIQVSSPAEFKAWLGALDLKTKPIAQLIDKSKKNISDEEKLRVSRWYYTINDPVKALEYAEAIEKPNADNTLWVKLLKVAQEKEFSAKLAADLNAMLPALSEASAFTLGEYKDAVLTGAIQTTTEPYDLKLLNQIAPLGVAYEKVLSARTDKLDASLKSISLNSAFKYVYEKTNQQKPAQVSASKVAAAIDSTPRLAGITETPFLTLMKADVLKDKNAKEKATAKLLEQNKNDYTYDYLNAQEEFEKKNYEQALVNIEKSLAIAKDRSWQKAFVLKLDILSAMKREAEGLKLIQALMTELRLPALPTMKVHGFVQTLRQKELEFQKAVKI